VIKKLPITIISGFLGSGKTTFLNRILQQDAFAHSAVLVNELGTIAIDDSLIASQNEQTITLSNGCICCSMQEDLIESLGDIINRLETGQVERIDQVFVETTGIADPTTIIRSLLLYPYISQHYELHGVVTLVDPLNFQTSVAEFPECRAQLAVADAILITKTDLLSGNDLYDFEALLSPYAHSAHIETTENVDKLFQYLDEQHGVRDVSEFLEPVSGANHSEFSTCSLRGDIPAGLDQLQQFIAAVSSRLGTDLLRMKGFLAIENQPGPVVIQMVRSAMAQPKFLSEWPPGDKGSRLVFIGTDLDHDSVRDCGGLVNCK
jgi:G3E family GTPase